MLLSITYTARVALAVFICCANGKSKGAVFARTEVATWSRKTESGRSHSDRCRFLQRILCVRTQKLDVAQFDFKQQVSFLSSSHHESVSSMAETCHSFSEAK